MTEDWKTRAIAAEAELKALRGEPKYATLKEELIAELPEPEESSENGTVGDAYPYTTFENYFKDKPERGFKKIGEDEIFQGRVAYPPFVEVFLFEVDGQLYAIDGESDSWEGGWPIYEYDTIRPVEKVTEMITQVQYKQVTL